MSQWYKWQLHLHYHHVWWVILHLKHVTRILFRSKKHFKIGSCNKLHIHLKTEISYETRLPEIIPTTKHMLCDIVSCQYSWVKLQTRAKMTSSPGPSCGQTWSKVVLTSSADHFCMDLCGDRSMKVTTTAQVTVQDIGWLLWGESFIFLYVNTLFPRLKELLCTDMASQIAAEMVSSLDSLSDLCCLYASKNLLPNSPEYTNCS